MAVILSRQFVILSEAKNPGLGDETLRFAQGDKGEFRNLLLAQAAGQTAMTQG